MWVSSDQHGLIIGEIRKNNWRVLFQFIGGTDATDFILPIHPIFMVYSIWKGLPDPIEYPDDLLIEFVDTSLILLNSLN